jgi:hypothetical protein
MPKIGLCDRAADSPLASGQLEPAGLPAVASPSNLLQRTDQYQAEFSAEICPQTPLGRFLVTQLGRSAAGIELAAEAEAGTMRFAAHHADAAQLFRTADPLDQPYLAAMSSSPPHARRSATRSTRRKPPDSWQDCRDTWRLTCVKCIASAKTKLRLLLPPTASPAPLQLLNPARLTTLPRRPSRCCRHLRNVYVFSCLL